MNCRSLVYQLITSILIILQFSCSNNSDENCNCDLVPEQGNCEAAIPKYYFDKEEKNAKNLYGEDVMELFLLTALKNVRSVLAIKSTTQHHIKANS